MRAAAAQSVVIFRMAMFPLRRRRPPRRLPRRPPAGHWPALGEALDPALELERADGAAPGELGAQAVAEALPFS
jgi:hypothetical protein